MSSALMLTIAEVAEILHCSTKTVRRRVKDGTIRPPIHIGRLVRWPYSGQLSDLITVTPANAG